MYGVVHKKLAEGQLNILENIAEHIVGVKKKTDAMTLSRKNANKLSDTYKKATAYCENVKPCFDEIRQHCDALEQLINDQIWPLTKYRELLFIK